MPCAISSAPTCAPSEAGPHSVAEASSRASCPPPYSICHMLYTPYAMCCFVIGSSICPVEIWSSLRCGGFLWGIMLSALFHMLLAISHVLFLDRLRHVSLRQLSSLTLRRLPRGHSALRHNRSLIPNV